MNRIGYCCIAIGCNDGKKKKDYKVLLDGYSGYLNFPETELIFEDTSKERDWKLKELGI